jgi:hypothetical protein
MPEPVKYMLAKKFEKTFNDVVNTVSAFCVRKSSFALIALGLASVVVDMGIPLSWLMVNGLPGT